MPTEFTQVDGVLTVKVPRGGLEAELLSAPPDLGDRSAIRAVRIAAPSDWRWGSVDAAFLASLLASLPEPVRTAPLDGVPQDLQSLLSLARNGGADASAPEAAPGFVARVGEDWMARVAGVGAFLELLGLLVLCLPRMFLGRAQVRRSEVLDVIAESSTRALMIVGIVNLLLGAILAFVGAVQLKAFGAGIYVADLVGIASIRELAPVMTAIVLAGRTGASFAARIATMQGNEEVDALTTLGVSPIEFLVLPRVVALSVLTPLLYIYAGTLALFGGMLVATAMLDVTAVGYLVETQIAIGRANFVLGIVKSVVFGAMVALIGCHCGLTAGRSAAAVGAATTDAVVISIVGIIAVDAVFAICANALGV